MNKEELEDTNTEDGVINMGGEEYAEHEIMPKKKVNEIMESLEMLAMQKGSKPSLDFSTLTPQQIDKVLETMDKNETNAFDYHKKRLDVYQTVRIKELETGVTEGKTNRIVKIGMIIAAFAITVLLLFFQKDYFVSWLTFITGIFGGMGLSNTSIVNKQNKKETTIEDEID